MIGQRIIDARNNVGGTGVSVSQGALANEVGVTAQQIHKYEAGANEIRIGLLLDISRVTGWPIEFFLKGSV